MQVLMQGVVSGALVRWLADEPDWGAESYEGEGTPTSVAISGGPPQGVNVEEAIETAISGAITFLPYVIERAIYTGHTLSVDTYATNIRTVRMSPDGLKLFVLAGAASSPASRVAQWTMSVARDILTATYDGHLSVAPQDDDPQAFDFNASGTRLYLAGNTGDAVYQYNLATPFDVTAGVTPAGSASVSAQATAPRGIAISPDGTALMVSNGPTVYQYTLATPGEIISGSMSYASLSRSTTQSYYDLQWGRGRDGTPGGRLFGIDGSRIRTIDCPTPYTLSGATVASTLFDPDEAPTALYGLYFSPDGYRVWVAGPNGPSGNTVNGYYTTAAVPAL